MLAFDAHLQKFFKLPASYKGLRIQVVNSRNNYLIQARVSHQFIPSIYGVFGKPDQVMMDGL